MVVEPLVVPEVVEPLVLPIVDEPVVEPVVLPAVVPPVVWAWAAPATRPSDKVRTAARSGSRGLVFISWKW